MDDRVHRLSRSNATNGHTRSADLTNRHCFSQLSCNLEREAGIDHSVMGKANHVPLFKTISPGCSELLPVQSSSRHQAIAVVAGISIDCQPACGSEAYMHVDVILFILSFGTCIDFLSAIL
jgi:hypothetical protein